MVKKSLSTGIWIAVKTICNFATNKIISVTFGPSGLTALSQLQSITALFLTLTQDGINQGTIKYLSEENTDTERRNTFSAGLILNIFVLITIILSALIGRNYLENFFQLDRPNLWLICLLVAFSLMILNYFFLGALLAWNYLRAYLTFQIIGSVFTVWIVYFAADQSSLPFAVLAAALGHCASSMLTIIYFWVQRESSGIISLAFEWSFVKRLGQYLVMAAAIMVFGRLTDLFLRQYVIDVFSMHDAGLWQSSLKLSDYYTTAFTSMLMVVYFPTISSLAKLPVQLRTYIFKSLQLFSPIIFVGLAGCYFYKTELLVFFFSHEFARADSLMKYVLFADLIKLNAFFLAYLLNAQARTKLFVWSEAASAVLYVILCILLSKFYGLHGLVLANLLRYFAYAVFLLAIYYKLLFPVKANHHKNENI